MIGKVLINGLAVVGAVAVTKYIYKKGYDAGKAYERAVHEEYKSHDRRVQNS